MAKPRPPTSAPWCPIQLQPGFRKAHASLVQRLFAGALDAEGQKQVVRFIVEDLCATYDLPYRPGEEGRRDTDFALGKSFVGKELVKLSKINLSLLKDET